MSFSVGDLTDEIQLRRKLLFTPCASKEGLRTWIKVYLGIDFPNQKLDEESTGSIIDTAWEIYRAGVTNDFTAPSRYMWYASRDSGKTLMCSVLEVLGMLHMRRNVVHLAAILQQSEKAADYYKGFLDRDGLSEFRVGENKRTVSVVWFENLATGDILTLSEWKELGGRSATGYRRHVHYIKIIVNSARSANSDHVNLLFVDELELIQYPKAYKEALFIPTTMKDEDGVEQPPITVITSSRKYAGGLVQDEIDSAEERGTAIRHHNIFDVTAKCPEDQYRPDKPKCKIFYSKTTLRTISSEDFRVLEATDPKLADTYIESEAYWGCARCKIFAGCQGVLSKQKCTASFLKPAYDAIRKFKEVGDIEMVKAQLLCWRPGNIGAIYSNFSRLANMLTLDQIWEEVTGEKSAVPVTKSALIEMFMQRGFKASGGVDWGFTHCFAVVVGFVVGIRLYVVDAFEVSGLEPHQCVEVCDKRIKFMNPLLWPDTGYPAYIKMFRSNGYRCREHKKDIVGGIEAVRKKILPAGRDPELYLIKGDDGCELLAKRIEGYRWKEDAVGRPSDMPREEEDDLLDSTRYLVQNTFEKGSGLVVAKETTIVPEKQKPNISAAQQEQMADKVRELTGGESFGSTAGIHNMLILGPNETFDQQKRRTGKGVSFFSDFS